MSVHEASTPGSRRTTAIHMGPALITVTHGGKHACDVVRISLAEFGVTSPVSFAVLCKLLGLPTRGRRSGLQRLHEFAQHSRALLSHLPAIAPVVEPKRCVLRPGVSDDPKVVVAVLCRSSAKVFIRDKSAIVTLPHLNREIALALPYAPKDPNP